MKKLPILIAIVLFAHNLPAQWIKLPSTNENFNIASFVDANTGWVADNSNYTNPQFTNDGGITWKSVIINEERYGKDDVYFPTKLEGYVLAGKYYLNNSYRTIDGGKTWVKFLPKTIASNEKGPTFLKKFKEGYYMGAYITDYNATIFKISASGSYTESKPTSKKSELFFCDSLTGYALLYNDQSVIQKSFDGGNSWNALGTGINERFNSLYFTDPFHGVAVGQNATIIHTSNGGLTWKVVSNKISGFNYNDITFTTPTIGYICGQQGTILKTIDGGLSWQTMKSGTFENLNKFSFPDSTLGFCVGDNGTVLKLIEDLTVPQVSSISLPKYNLCAGGSYSLSYTVNKKYTQGNVFKAYLSNGVGEFVSTTPIGISSSDTSGSILITIPANTPRNFGYRIRIESDSPISTSAANDGFIEIQPSATPTINIATTQTHVCEGTEVSITTKITNGGTMPKVSWYSGSQLVSIQPNFKAIPKDKDKYWARVKSNAVCATPDSATSNTIVLKVISPTKPTISLAGNTLTSSFTTGNQWYKDAESILSATAPTFTATESGMYKVAVNDGVCPPQFSETVNVLVTGAESASELSAALTIYPNPTNEILKISTRLQLARLVVYQSNGIKVLETKATENLDVSALPEGLYLLEAWDMEGRRVLRKFEKR
ncbi:MAG: T9SS C-terminal target domain-containing protein [Cytophagales bacterium]|nr:MAG: T9SS C-terminal target domain-containing protein [Cytophagales bacterium]